jgi:hypothetical protein
VFGRPRLCPRFLLYRISEGRSTVAAIDPHAANPLQTCPRAAPSPFCRALEVFFTLCASTHDQDRKILRRHPPLAAAFQEVQPRMVLFKRLFANIARGAFSPPRIQWPDRFE